VIADQDKERTDGREEPHSENIGPIVLIGPPGSGKGTQSSLLAEHFQVPQVSTGALLREHVALATRLGAQVSALIAKGELVPDHLVCDVVAARLREPDARRGFVLDGFPRTQVQAVWLGLFLDFEFGDAKSRQCLHSSCTFT
jgi:adenylate kinase